MRIKINVLVVIDFVSGCADAVSVLPFALIYCIVNKENNSVLLLICSSLIKKT